MRYTGSLGNLILSEMLKALKAAYASGLKAWKGWNIFGSDRVF
jgi:hypothetical protein